MRKKIVALLISACTVLTLAGCAEKEVSNKYITIPKYKGIEIAEVEKTEVSEEEIETSINTTLEVNAKEVDRAAKEGDHLVIDFVGKKDGKAFDGGSAEDTPVVIGSGEFIPGFEEGLIGHKKGETFDVDVTFPENYGNPDLDGQKTVFTMTIKEIKAVPELDDAFVKENSKKSKTVKEYKEEVKKDLEKTNEEARQGTINEDAWAKVLEGAKVSEYPEDKVQEALEQLKQQYTMIAGYMGLDLETYLQDNMGMTMDDFNKEAEKAAKDMVKEKLAIELLSEKLRINLSEDEYKEEYKAMAKEYGYESADALIEQAGEDALKEMIIRQKVVEWVGKNCIQVEASK